MSIYCCEYLKVNNRSTRWWSCVGSWEKSNRYPLTVHWWHWILNRVINHWIYQQFYQQANVFISLENARHTGLAPAMLDTPPPLYYRMTDLEYNKYTNQGFSLGSKSHIFSEFDREQQQTRKTGYHINGDPSISNSLIQNLAVSSNQLSFSKACSSHRCPWQKTYFVTNYVSLPHLLLTFSWTNMETGCCSVNGRPNQEYTSLGAAAGVVIWYSDLSVPE